MYSELMYVRGGQIRFIILPDMLSKAPFFTRIKLFRKYKGHQVYGGAVGASTPKSKNAGGHLLQQGRGGARGPPGVGFAAASAGGAHGAGPAGGFGAPPGYGGAPSLGRGGGSFGGGNRNPYGPGR